MPRLPIFAAALAALSLLVVVSAPGCGSDDAAPPAFGNGGDAGSGDGSSTTNPNGICLLNHCADDSDCADCTSDRKFCSSTDKRCIACGPSAGNRSCKPGQYCTKYGECVPNGVHCDEDSSGNPTVTCQNNADCGACGPNFRVCDTGTSKCVGCLGNDTTYCQSTDLCKDNHCVAKCPKQCATDGDCGECGATGKEAHACNRHVCAQCSTTLPCPGNAKCDLNHGTCVKQCGLGRKGKANCTKDDDCAGCTGTTVCDLPINGGEGECAAPVTGCSDLGKGIFVLPDPFSRYTNLCSSDTDCSSVSADVNVGKLVRDATGLDLIKDASIPYAMHACANVTIKGKSCGLCVPCKVDTDCQDIDITKLAGDAFGPIGSIASKILLDKAFGPSDRKVHMFCQNVSGDYGVCLPCPNLLERCADGGDVPPNGACDHDICEEGGPLGVQCPDQCVATVCAHDPYCCTTAWDYQCKVSVDNYCTDKTCEPDKCVYRPAGWYCFADASKGGYLCTGDPGETQIAEGRQCGLNEECHIDGTSPKDPAVLCESEDESGCGTGSVGKPRCFAK